MTHIPLQHDLPPLDLPVVHARVVAQLLSRLRPAGSAVARKHLRRAEVREFELGLRLRVRLGRPLQAWWR